VALENLVLKKRLVDMLELPVSLVHGVIGRFELRIPWSNMGNEPVVCVIDKVHLVVEPKYEWDAEARKVRV
jgi:vacuolar protein sorting-associated protein 13A/C